MMLRRGALVAVAVGTFVLGSGAAAAAQELEISFAGEQPLPVAPQKTVTIPVVISNPSDNSLDVQARLELPEGWRSVTAVAEFGLPPGSDRLGLFAVHIPQSARAGRYDLQLTVVDAADSVAAASSTSSPIIRARSDISVEVAERPGAEISVRDTPDYVVNTDNYEIRAAIANTGNTPLELDIRARADEGAAAEIAEPETGIVILDPGERYETRIRVSQLRGVSAPRTATVHLEALRLEAVRGETNDVLARAAVQTEIIPEVSTAVDPFRRFPLELQLGHVQDLRDDGAVAVGEVAVQGRGEIDAEGAHYLDLLLRKRVSSEDEELLLNTRDRYLLEYRTGPFQLAAGDRAYSLSELLQPREFGRGVELGLTDTAYTTRVYYHNSFLEPRPEDTFAGSASYRLPARNLPDSFRYEIGLNLLGIPQSHFAATLLQRYRPTRDTTILAEAGIGLEPDRELGSAFHVRSFGTVRGLEFDSDIAVAQPGFPGHLQDTISASGSVRLALMNGALAVNAGGDFRRGGFGAGSANAEPRQDWSAKVGTKYAVARSDTTLIARYLVNSDSEWEDGTRRSLRDQEFRLSMNQPLSRLRLRTTAVWDIRYNLGNDRRTLLQTITVGAGADGPQELLSVDAEASYTDSSDPNLYPRELRSGASLRYGDGDVDAGLRGAVAYQFDAKTLDTARYSYGLDVERRLSERDGISFAVHHVIHRRGERTDHALQGEIWYGRRVGVPLGRRSDVGSLSGKVSELDSGEPLAGVVLRAGGLAAVTDGNGSYRFPALPEGSYRLRIDRASIPHALVALRSDAEMIRVEGGRGRRRDISLVRSAEMSGRLVRYAYPSASDQFLGEDSPTGRDGETEVENSSSRSQPDALREVEPLSGVEVILRSGDGRIVLRRVTGPEGRFSFEQLEPGEWYVEPSGTTLPEGYVYELPDTPITLAPAETRELEIRAVPKRRRMRMLEEGRTLGDE